MYAANMRLLHLFVPEGKKKKSEGERKQIIAFGPGLGFVFCRGRGKIYSKSNFHEPKEIKKQYHSCRNKIGDKAN